MSLNERIISEAIITRYFEKFNDSLQLDAAIVGAGPAGLTAAWKLAERGVKVAIFERKLSVGGGMWGGGMTYNEIVVQEEGRRILDEAGVPSCHYKENYYTCDAVTATVTLASKACLAGARIFNCISAEDVIVRGEGDNRRVTGIVINSSPVEIAGLHVDPLAIETSFIVEASGHPTELLQTLVRKNDIRLNTSSGGIDGEKSMWAEVAESTTMDNTREVFPGVYVCGMAANACYGSYRMGPIFGGMLLSGEKAAVEIAGRFARKQ